MQDVMDYRYINTTGYPMEDGIEMDWREYDHDSLIYSKLRDYFFVTEADYEAQTGEQLRTFQKVQSRSGRTTAMTRRWS